jgi:S-adenosylmethionine:tRNA ribosyltransferase-isomerase
MTVQHIERLYHSGYNLSLITSTFMSLLETIRSIHMEPYDYSLEDDRIAKYPVEPRDSSNLLLYRSGSLSHTRFSELPGLLEPDSLLVYNNTKVIHARLFFQKETGAHIEIFCLEPLSPADYAQNFQAETTCEWMCLIGNLKKWKQGKLSRNLTLGGRDLLLTAERCEPVDNAFRVRFHWDDCPQFTKDGSPLSNSIRASQPVRFGDLLETAGQIPIPPYLNRQSEASDETTYQTVYSKIEGSVAAPTAGLHFTGNVLKGIDQQRIRRSEVTLHVGAGTFKPVQSDRLRQHTMHAEFITVERSLIEDLIRNEGHTTAVGTTTVRTLESLYWFGHQLVRQPHLQPLEWTLDQWYAYQEDSLKDVPDLKTALNALLTYLDNMGYRNFTASTRLLIAPGYVFKVVNTLITNFHQPKSTLLLLVSAFLGEEKWKDVYQYALDNGFRFLSYGDSSLLRP